MRAGVKDALETDEGEDCISVNLAANTRLRSLKKSAKEFVSILEVDDELEAPIIFKESGPGFSSFTFLTFEGIF